jgi:2-keto-4-pentenoate hydratase
MEPAKVRDAARLLVEARRTGKRVPGLPQECKPVTATDANAIIDEVTRQMGEPIVGWKISFVYKPREKAFRAPLFASRVFASPARVPLSLTPSLLIEPEITFRLTRDLPGRERLYRPEEIGDAVEAFASLEIVDTRFDTTNRTIEQMLNERASRVEAYSDHITNGAFVIGQARKDWRDLDFAVMRMRMSADDETIVETEGGHAFVDPFPGVVVLANELRRGPGLQAGQVVATGSFSGFFPVQANQRITAEFDGVGQATAMLVP